MNLTAKSEKEIRDSFFKHCPENFLEKCISKNSISDMHIPKTGGTFLKKFFENLPIDYINNGHQKCNPKIDLYPDPTDSVPKFGLYQDDDSFEKSLKICVVRNPFEWLVSYYFHEQGDLLKDPPWTVTKGVGGIRWFYKNFEEFCLAYINEEKYWPPGLSEFRRFYPFQIFYENGNCAADFIIKNSSKNELTTAAVTIAAAYGIDPRRIGDSLIKRKNTSKAKKKDYRHYYPDHLVDSLNKKWESILNVLEYDFYSGSTSDKIILDASNLKREGTSLLRI